MQASGSARRQPRAARWEPRHLRPRCLLGLVVHLLDRLLGPVTVPTLGHVVHRPSEVFDFLEQNDVFSWVSVRDGTFRAKLRLVWATSKASLGSCACATLTSPRARGGPAPGSAVPRGFLEPGGASAVSRAKMAARCSTRWLLVAVGNPRLPAAAGIGARPPPEGVIGASLGRQLSVAAFAPSLGARGPRALLTLRPGVSLTGEGRLLRSNGGSRN